MARDHLVEEVRRVREEQSAKYAFDVKTILAAARKRQRRSGRKVVPFPGKTRLSAERRAAAGDGQRAARVRARLLVR